MILMKQLVLKGDNMKTFTNEEAKALRGTEFIYEFEDGDTVPAFIAEVDFEIGLTCKALAEYTTRDNWRIWTDYTLEDDPKNYDNVICVPIDKYGAIEFIQEALNNIMNNGIQKESALNTGNMFSCSF